MNRKHESIYIWRSNFYMIKKIQGIMIAPKFLMWNDVTANLTVASLYNSIVSNIRLFRRVPSYDILY